MNIDDLTAMIRKRSGFAKPNRFEVKFTLPNTISDDGGRDLTLLCESASMPGKQIMTFEWAAFGHSIKVPHNFIQEDVSCIFNLTNDFYAKDIFDKWQNLVIDNENYSINYDDVFKSNMTIIQLDENDKEIYEYILYRAYPVNVGSLILDNNSENQIHRLPVTFSYNNYSQRKI